MKPVTINQLYALDFLNHPDGGLYQEKATRVLCHGEIGHEKIHPPGHGFVASTFLALVARGLIYGKDGRLFLTEEGKQVLAKGKL